MTIQMDVPLTERYDFTLDTKPGTVRAVSYTYPIYVRAEPDWREFALLLTGLHADHITLVADAGLPPALVSLVYRQLSTLGVPCLLISLEVTEQAKTMETALSLAYQARADGGGTHASCFVALGGGLVGNITGLAAALLVRGVKLIHIPTTLLAGTDSILSCKQGVNGQVAGGTLVKNLVGLFYAPELVLVYPSLWLGLPADEIRSGLCELIKNVVSIHPHLYQEVFDLLNPAANYTLGDYLRIFQWCFEAKHAVMRQDAHEQGPALALENGHTLGHSIEIVLGIRHGHAIGLGLLVSAHIAHARGYLTSEDVEMHYQLLVRNGVATTLPANLPVEELMSLVCNDNKIGYLPRRAGYHAMVVLRTLGQPASEQEQDIPLVYVSDSEVRAAIAAVQRKSE